MIGELREPIEIYRLAPIADGGGGFDPQWSLLRSTFARARGLSAVQRTIEGEATLYQRKELLVRYDEDILPADRVRHRGRDYAIRDFGESTSPRRFLRLVVEEVSS
ncbi:MAG: head-tail adaptor protein [Parvularcula sp.]